MKQRDKFINKDQFQLNFQAGTGSFQEKEKELNAVKSAKAFKFKAIQKSQSKGLSKKASLSKLEESACSSKQAQAVFFDNLITVEELAVVFGLAPQTIRNWVALGKLPYVKIGKRNMFLKGSLQEWLNQKEVPQWQ
ncbi:MAG: helix-turn-helix domain-containing protein [Oligoflexia bacterium]|nr:helix-turn-helix domain-containing protein [Oligoflexia bacterium]